MGKGSRNKTLQKVQKDFRERFYKEQLVKMQSATAQEFYKAHPHLGTPSFSVDITPPKWKDKVKLAFDVVRGKKLQVNVQQGVAPIPPKQ